MYELLMSANKLPPPPPDLDWELDEHTVAQFSFNGPVGSNVIYADDGRPTTIIQAGYSLTAEHAFTGATSIKSGGSFELADELSLHLDGDFTIEGFIWVDHFGQNSALLGKGSGALIQVYSNNLYMRDDSLTYRCAGAIGPTSRWNHFAFTKIGDDWFQWSNGAKVSEVNGVGTFGNNTLPLRVLSSFAYNVPFDGYLDMLRISDIARYNNPFTIPGV